MVRLAGKGLEAKYRVLQSTASKRRFGDTDSEALDLSDAAIPLVVCAVLVPLLNVRELAPSDGCQEVLPERRRLRHFAPLGLKEVLQRELLTYVPSLQGFVNARPECLQVHCIQLLIQMSRLKWRLEPLRAGRLQGQARARRVARRRLNAAACHLGYTLRAIPDW